MLVGFDGERLDLQTFFVLHEVKNLLSRPFELNSFQMDLFSKQILLDQAEWICGSLVHIAIRAQNFG